MYFWCSTLKSCCMDDYNPTVSYQPQPTAVPPHGHLSTDSPHSHCTLGSVPNQYGITIDAINRHMPLPIYPKPNSKRNIQALRVHVNKQPCGYLGWNNHIVCSIIHTDYRYKYVYQMDTRMDTNT